MNVLIWNYSRSVINFELIIIFFSNISYCFFLFYLLYILMRLKKIWNSHLFSFFFIINESLREFNMQIDSHSKPTQLKFKDKIFFIQESENFLLINYKYNLVSYSTRNITYVHDVMNLYNSVKIHVYNYKLKNVSLICGVSYLGRYTRNWFVETQSRRVQHFDFNVPRDIQGRKVHQDPYNLFSLSIIWSRIINI